MFDRLQTRIVLLFAILFVAVQGMTSFAVYRATTTNIDVQVSEQLNYSASIVQQGLANDVSQLADGTRLLSSDFGFRAAVASRDYPTILSALANLVNRIEADSAFLISLDEEIIADTSIETLAIESAFKFPELIEIADLNGQATTFVNEGGNLYEMVLMPVLAPIPIAWIGIRLEMDNEKAQLIKAILPNGIDISFVLRNESSAPGQEPEQWRLIASTLLDELRNELAFKINTTNDVSGETDLLTLDGKHFMALSVDFPTQLQSANVSAIMQYSLDVAYSPYQSLIISLALLIAFGLLALVLGSFFISRSVTQPISALANSAKEISQGKYSPVAQNRRKDEVHQLASSFNIMVDSIKQREAKIIYQAEHDLATGLPNRRGFDNHVDTMISSGSRNFCLLEISVYRFRDIRNALGFSISETLIKEVGPRLALLVPESDLLARIGSATFQVSLPMMDQERAYDIGLRIIKGFEQAIKIDSATIDVQVNIGLVSYPKHGKKAEVLLQRANIARFQSEGLIKHIAVYDESKDQSDADNLSLMSELRKALDENSGEIEFYYQPKIDIKLGIISHAEALIRWNHPERGYISPEEFIPLAEQTGHIHHITRWALENGIQQAARWQEAGIAIKLAINLSAKDLANKELPEIILGVLKKYNVNTERMVMEITESAVMEDPELALSVLNELNNMDLTLSIDDYGTGYSSMAYLKRLPVKELKIDKSFVQHLTLNSDDEIIVRSTIELGHNLGLTVIAEGIEEEESFAILRSLDCDMVQGYFFTKPLPLKEFDRFLTDFDFERATKAI